MAVNPMLHSGMSGIARGIKSLDSVAQEIAELNVKSNPSTNPIRNAGDGEPHCGFSLDEVADAIVDLKLYQRQVQASARVVQTADEVIGFLLDIRA